MTFDEKDIYHLIRPINLATDIGKGFIAVGQFWQKGDRL